MTPPVLSHLQYVSNAPGPSHRARDQGKRVSGYRRTDDALHYIESRPNLNPESTLALGQHGYWFNHGAGENCSSILRTMIDLKTHHKLMHLALLSPDPALMAYIPPGDRFEAIVFMADATLKGFLVEQGLPTLPYSFAIHDKLDALGRQQLHAHGVLSASGFDHLTGKYKPLHVWDNTQRLAGLADEQMRLTLGTFVERSHRDEVARLLDAQQADDLSHILRPTPLYAAVPPIVRAAPDFFDLVPQVLRRQRKRRTEAEMSVDGASELLIEPDGSNIEKPEIDLDW